MKVKLPFCLILLMITGAALADTKTLYYMGATWNDYCIGSHTGTLFKTPQQAQQMCGFKDYDLVGPSANGDYGLAKNGTTWFAIYAKTQSCELKDILSHNGDKVFTLNLPYSEKGAPNMMRSCVNNCERESRRIRKMGDNANTEESGSLCVEGTKPGKLSFCTSSYTIIQTGAVCTLKPGEKDDTKYDDVTANPGDDNGNGGADGKGMDGDSGKNGSDNPGKPPKQDGQHADKSDGRANGSDGSGNQSGGQGRDGADSPRDSGSADEPVEDKDKDKNKDKDKPGKGKGKGGGGGGNHGDKDKDDKDKADDDKGGDPKGGEGKGDGKGDGKDGDKDGKDNADGSPNGTDNGTGTGGDKDGQGSGISGGDCKTGKAPSCKGET